MTGIISALQVKIEELVTAMGGTLLNKAALDVNFVVAKNVLAAKYKVNGFLYKSLCILWGSFSLSKEHPYQLMFRILCTSTTI